MGLNGFLSGLSTSLHFSSVLGKSQGPSVGTVHCVVTNVALGRQISGNKGVIPVCATLCLTHRGLCSACVHTAEERHKLLLHAD